MNVLIEKMDHQGRGIAYLNQKIVFVPDSLPGELVDVGILKEKKKYSEAIVLKNLKPSVDRIMPLCPYDRCGGCCLKHLNYEAELKYKYNKVKEIIDRFVHVGINVKPIIGFDGYNYRNKITLHNDLYLGYFSKKTNEIIEIDNCVIANEKINKILLKLKKIKLDNVYEVVIRSSLNIADSMVILKINGSVNENYYITNLKDEVDTIILYKNKEYLPIYGKGYILEELDGYKFKISADSFFQVNTIQAKNLYGKVLEYIKPSGGENVLDLYCGTGTIGIYISKYVGKVYGVEINEMAVRDAKFNKKLNNVFNIDFECLDASLIDKLNSNFDVVIVDPPRGGLSVKTIEYLIDKKFKKIIYVSCDPMTLARDLKQLNNVYDIDEITPFDMFKNTYHVECVCMLNRRQ